MYVHRFHAKDLTRRWSLKSVHRLLYLSAHTLNPPGMCVFKKASVTTLSCLCLDVFATHTRC